MKAALLQTVKHNKRFADWHRSAAPKYHPGQKLWLSTKDIKLKDTPRNLAPGLLAIFLDQDHQPIGCSPTVTIIHEDPSHVPCLLDNTCFLLKVPHPQLINKHPAFTVRCHLVVWRRGWGFQYLVDWEGYGPEEHSWVPRSLILDPTLITHFYRENPDKRKSQSILEREVL